MTIDQYTAEIARCQRQLIWRMVIAIAPVFLAFGIAGIVRYNNPDLADFVGPILVFAVGLPMMLCGFVYADRTHKSFPMLLCPHCDGNLSRSKSVIIATGNCPNCGRRILTDAAIGT
jgi:4-amino-4-deoxy-L-arabinose transferase-like glycosyltransferase